ncbi:AEC family transporter [Pacificispira sp.]|uniref:AEC family transporter n=1 Tax=Pacificispira sp. TaxID=2888761 RepID=UPI003BAA8EC4
MQALIDVSIPVFAIILAGYLAGRFKLLGQDSTAALNGFVYFIALPAMFLSSTSQAPVADVLDWRLLAVIGGGYFATAIPVAVIARIFFSKRIGEIGLHSAASVFANTGYMGIPLVLTAFGAAATNAMIATVLANLFIVLGIASAVMEVDRTGASGPRVVVDAVRGLVRSPLLCACAAGMVLSALQWTIPGPALKFLDLLGASAGPCALFAMGLFLVGQSVRRGAGEVAWITVVKLAVHPMATWLIAHYLIPLDPLEEAVAVIMAALPTGGLIFVLAQRYGVYVQRATAAILVSTIVSIATVSFAIQHYVDLIGS